MAMNLGSFPSAINVTLGTNWQGGGNGLNSGQSHTLQQAQSTSDYVDYTESGNMTQNSSTNRLWVRMRSVGSNDHISAGVTTYNGNAWNVGTNYQIAAAHRIVDILGAYDGGSYTFLDAWNYTGGPGGNGNLRPNSKYSWNQGTTSASLSPATWQPKVFSTFEAGGGNLDEDRTSYRYG